MNVSEAYALESNKINNRQQRQSMAFVFDLAFTHQLKYRTLRHLLHKDSQNEDYRHFARIQQQPLLSVKEEREEKWH